MKRIFIYAFIICSLMLLLSCADNSTNIKSTPTDPHLRITFIELGSETCVPCQQMRPVMDSIQMKYGKQILVKFIDVIRNSSEAAPFNIKVMPTQVFLDSLNNEVHRHKGFYAEDSIHIFLQSKGLKIIND